MDTNTKRYACCKTPDVQDGRCRCGMYVAERVEYCGNQTVVVYVYTKERK